MTFTFPQLAKGWKYHEPKSVSWTHNINIIINCVDDYTKQWTRR